jgi:polysaccharide export outer membrane protein
MRKLILLLVLPFLLFSCVAKKDVLLVQNLKEYSKINPEDFNTHIKTDDLLRIVVSSQKMEAVKDFNLFVSPVMGNDVNVIGQQQLFGYLVDENGYIEFPIIGSVKMSGLTVQEAISKLKDRISDYVVDPITVDIRIINYKITVLGEVNSPGTYNMQSNRTTLLQALGFAKDLTIYGNRKTVTIIREVDGEQTSKVVDLTSADFFNDEFYYVQQNDVIIVHPNNAQIQSAGFNRNAPLFVSIASLLLSIILIITRS